jgi:hypothetical protein
VEFFRVEGIVGGCGIGFWWVGRYFEHRWNSSTYKMGAIHSRYQTKGGDHTQVGRPEHWNRRFRRSPEHGHHKPDARMRLHGVTRCISAAGLPNPITGFQ